MPERSAKMNRRIFGFHRRVWWPKCTPASSRSWSWGCAMRAVVSYPCWGCVVHRVHLRSTPQGHPELDPAVCEIAAGRSVQCRRVSRTCSSSLRGSLRSASTTALALAELEPLPRARPARLLPLDRARIAGQQSRGPELGPVRTIGLHQRPRDRHAAARRPARPVRRRPRAPSRRRRPAYRWR